MDRYQGSYQNSDVEFHRLSNSIGSNIQKILQNVSSMQRMIAQIGTAQENQQLQNQLRQIQHYTGQLAKDTSQQWKELNTLWTAQGGDQRQWKIQRDRLQNDFTRALNTFQAAQRSCAQKEKESIRRAKSQSKQALLPGPGKSDTQNLIDIENGGSDSGTAGSNAFAAGQSKTQLLLEEEHNMEQLHEREAAMRQLESDIVDVNTIFKDLATMVHEQGEIVDSIEANVESTQVRVSEGTDQLRQAEQYKMKTRKKKFMMLCLGTVLLAFLIGIICWQAS